MRRSTCVALALFISSNALGFCRRTTCPDCPSDPLTGCPTGGRPVAWPKRCVSYALARAASRQVDIVEATQIATAAFDAWQSVACPGSNEPPSVVASEAFGHTDCSDAVFEPGGPNSNSIVFRDDAWPHDALSDAVAFTTTNFDETTGDILDADIEINGTLPLSTSDVVPKKSYDLLSILTHEAGHFFGLAHSYERGATMQPSMRPGTSDNRVLGDDDIAGICAIYPPGRSAQPCDFAPRGGFAAACPAAKASGGCSVSVGTRTWSSFPFGGCAAVIVVLMARWRPRRLPESAIVESKRLNEPDGGQRRLTARRSARRTRRSSRIFSRR